MKIDGHYQQDLILDNIFDFDIRNMKTIKSVENAEAKGYYIFLAISNLRGNFVCISTFHTL